MSAYAFHKVEISISYTESNEWSNSFTFNIVYANFALSSNKQEYEKEREFSSSSTEEYYM
jgi:hypothetical protein